MFLATTPDRRQYITGKMEGLGCAEEESMPRIRKARLGDAKAVAKIAEATFRATFSAVNAPEHMKLHCQTSYGEPIQAAEIANSRMLTLVSEDGNRMAGYAQVRWGDAPDCVSAANPGEIQRLYVVKDWHGQGIAQALMRACLDEIRQRGSDAAWLGVWEHNPRAIAFYKKSGFVEVGAHIFSLGGDLQRDLIMVASVAADWAEVSARGKRPERP